MKDLIGIFFEDIRFTISIIVIIAIFGAIFGVLSEHSDEYIQDEQAKENLENIESVSMNSLYILLAAGGIATIFAILAWVSGFLEFILNLIKI